MVFSAKRWPQLLSAKNKINQGSAQQSYYLNIIVRSLLVLAGGYFYFFNRVVLHGSLVFFVPPQEVFQPLDPTWQLRLVLPRLINLH